MIAKKTHWSRHGKVGAAMAAATVLLAACSSPPGDPSAEDEAAFLRDYVAATIASARQAGMDPTRTIEETLDNLTPSQRERGIDLGKADCERLRSSTDESADAIRVGRALAADNDQPGDPLDTLILAVEHLCPDLEPDLEEVRTALDG